MGIIPTALNIHLCVSPVSDGRNNLGQLHESVPCVAAGVHDGLIILVDFMAEIIAAHILPEIFGRIEFRGVGRQGQQNDIIWDLEPRRTVPSSPVEDQQGNGTHRHIVTDFGQMLVHRLYIGGRHDDGGTDAAQWAGRTKEIGRGKAVILGRAGARAAPGPDTGQCALLADAGLVLPPNLDGFALGAFWDLGACQFGEVFLKVSCASGSLSGC